MKLRKIRQNYKCDRIEDVKGELEKQLGKLTGIDLKGKKIAVAVGSRGIANLSDMVATLVSFLKDQGADPFIVPAMGSHGGATAEGQTEVLKSLGVDEGRTGAKIISSMDVVEISSGKSRFSVCMDKHAHESDGVILVGRIKPHTDYHGPYESGLCKMAVIGLGKHAQALEIHRFGAEGLKDLIPDAARVLFDTGRMLFGVAVVENALDETARIECVMTDDIMKREPELLDIAWDYMPSLPVDRIDVLIVDRLGKNISGTGMDSNIIGRMMIRGMPEPERPDISKIVVCDISDESHGNAVGVGFAEVITKRLFDKINFDALYENVFTSTFLERARIPVVASDAARAFEIALRSACVEPKTARVMRIRDTLNIGEIYVSEAIDRELSGKVKHVSDYVDIFKDNGDLIDF